MKNDHPSVNVGPNSSASASEKQPENAQAQKADKWAQLNLKYWGIKWRDTFNPDKKPWWIRLFLFKWLLSKLFIRDLHKLSELVLEGTEVPPQCKDRKTYYTMLFLCQKPESIEASTRDAIAKYAIAREESLSLARVSASLGAIATLNNTCEEIFNLADTTVFNPSAGIMEHIRAEWRWLKLEVSFMIQPLRRRFMRRSVVLMSVPPALKKLDDRVNVVMTSAKQFGIIDRKAKLGDFKSVAARKATRANKG